MDYYETRKQVINVIDKMFGAGISIEKVIIHIEKTYGFSAKICRERFKILVKDKENDLNLAESGTK
mgnify:CR=1 FL=1